MELEARAKIPKPQPQTARAMATLGVDLGGPQLGGPNNGHPVGKLSNRAELAACVDPRGEGEQTSTNDEEDTYTSTHSIWDSHANHGRDPADSFMVALMAATWSALVLVIMLWEFLTIVGQRTENTISQKVVIHWAKKNILGRINVSWTFICS
jgi:hypothetical protein